MSISYNGLFSLLQKKGLTKTALTGMLGISSRTMSKLSKNEYVHLRLLMIFVQSSVASQVIL